MDARIGSTHIGTSASEVASVVTESPPSSTSPSPSAASRSAPSPSGALANLAPRQRGAIPPLAALAPELRQLIGQQLATSDLAALTRTGKAVHHAFGPLLEGSKIAYGTLNAKIAAATTFDDLHQLMSDTDKPSPLGQAKHTTIASWDASMQAKLYPAAAIALARKLHADLTTLPTESAMILKQGVSDMAQVKPEDLRAAGLGIASSKLAAVPRDQQQAVFDHIVGTLHTLPPTSRGQALKSLAANLFKTPNPGASDSRAAAQHNLHAVLSDAMLNGLSDQDRIPILLNLAYVMQQFAAGGGDWRTPFDTLLAETNRTLPTELHTALKQQLASTLDNIEAAGIGGVEDARRQLQGLAIPAV